MNSEAAILSRLFSEAPTTVEFRRLRKRLARQTEEAISRYHMRAGAERPKWLVCLSGGKDSYSLLTVLMDLVVQGRLDADLIACNLDQMQPGFPKNILPDYLDALGVPYRIETRDTYSTVIEKTAEGATLCSLCSRLRRGHLYRVAREEGCEAIVLGHHRDDILETFFLNLFFGGRLEAMPPKLLNDKGDLLTLRPLSLCAEDDIAAFSKAMAYPIIPCDLCGSQDGLQRQQIKHLLTGWEESHPGRKETIFRALSTARPGHLLDPELFNFAGLAAGTESKPQACLTPLGVGPASPKGL